MSKAIQRYEKFNKIIAGHKGFWIMIKATIAEKFETFNITPEGLKKLTSTFQILQ